MIKRDGSNVGPTLYCSSCNAHEGQLLRCTSTIGFLYALAGYPLRGNHQCVCDLYEI